MPGILLFFDISSGEIFLILIIAFIIFGPSKFPELARKVGKGINEVRRASDSIKREIKQEANKMEREMNLDKDIDDVKKETDRTDPGRDDDYMGENTSKSNPDTK